MYTVIPLPAFSDNYIWLLRNDQGPEVAVVDPGDAAVVEAFLQRHGLNLVAILITHHHQDHTGGVADLCRQRDIPVYGPADSPFRGISHPLKSDDTLSVLGQQLRVREIPGHTLDHISYLCEGDTPQLFCGDTLFLAGCGRLFEGSAAQMLEAMRYFQQLPDATQVYCTHEYSLANLAFAAAVEPGNAAIQASIRDCQALRAQNRPTLPTHIGTERQINPFLRTRSPAVIQAAENFHGESLPDEAEVFAAIRAWKNQF